MGFFPASGGRSLKAPPEAGKKKEKGIIRLYSLPSFNIRSNSATLCGATDLQPSHVKITTVVLKRIFEVQDMRMNDAHADDANWVLSRRERVCVLPYLKGDAQTWAQNHHGASVLYCCIHSTAQCNTCRPYIGHVTMIYVITPWIPCVLSYVYCR